MRSSSKSLLVRTAVPEKTWHRFVEVAEVLGYEDKALYRLCASIGLRMFEMSIMGKTSEQLSAELDKKADQAVKMAQEIAIEVSEGKAS